MRTTTCTFLILYIFCELWDGNDTREWDSYRNLKLPLYRNNIKIEIYFFFLCANPRIEDKCIRIYYGIFLKILYRSILTLSINIMLWLVSKLQFLKMCNPIFKILIFFKLANYKVNNTTVIKVCVLNNEKTCFNHGINLF